MFARKPTARYIFIAAVIIFALILAFFLWAAASEARTIDSPVTTPIATSVPAVSTMPAGENGTPLTTP